MGNRSRSVVGAGLSAAVVAAVRRRRRVRDAALAIGEAIEPSVRRAGVGVRNRGPYVPD